jgi:hypothetical protein
MHVVWSAESRVLASPACRDIALTAPRRVRNYPSGVYRLLLTSSTGVDGRSIVVLR